MSGQLCRVAEALNKHYITLSHRHPPPSPQKSDTQACANPVRRGLGRRIHGSVEDTKLSTNKQHTLSLKNLGAPGFPSAPRVTFFEF
jgi:hypothetical protein